MSVSIHPRVWLNHILPIFRPWERQVLDAWLEQTDPETREIIRDQLKRINFVQRNQAGNVVNMYFIRYGLCRGDFPNLLPTRSPDAQLSEVDLTIDGKPVKAELWAANGRLFSLEFSRSPRQLIKQGRLEIKAVRRAPSYTREELVELLPSDYLELSRRPEFDARVSILPLEEVHSTTTDAGRFWVLAELPDFGVLGIPVDGEDKRIRLLFYDGRPPHPLSTSFAEALSQAFSATRE
jgi:hypothetical protein